VKQKNVFSMDIYRIFTSKLILISIFSVTLFCFISIYQDVPFEHFDETNIIDIIDILFGLSMFKKILIILASFPVVTIFCQDWNSQYIRPVLIRCDSRKYTWSKIFVSQLSSLFVVFVGMLLFSLILLIFSPIASNNIETYKGLPFENLLIGGLYSLYIFIIIFLFSLGTSLWVIIGLTVSSFIPNRFVAIISPFIAGYLIEEFTRRLPSFLNLYILLRIWFDTGKGDFITLLYYIFIFELLIIVNGCIFSHQVKRRIRNEVV